MILKSNRVWLGFFFLLVSPKRAKRVKKIGPESDPFTINLKVLGRVLTPLPTFWHNQSIRLLRHSSEPHFPAAVAGQLQFFRRTTAAQLPSPHLQGKYSPSSLTLSITVFFFFLCFVWCSLDNGMIQTGVRSSWSFSSDGFFWCPECENWLVVVSVGNDVYVYQFSRLLLLWREEIAWCLLFFSC